MKILVTGSTGFVGGAICQALVKQGHQVRAFHRTSSSLKLLEGLEVEHVTGDLTLPETIPPAMQGIEVVFHVAAQLNVGSDPAHTYAITVAGTRAVLQAAQAAGVRRVVHTSSVAALGVPEKGPIHRGPQVALIDETHTWNYPPARWRYGYAKYQAELEVQNAVANGLDVVIVNPAVVFGAGDIYRTSNSLITASAQRRLPPFAIPGGLNVVAIEDVVAGHLAALSRGRRGERYILGGENLSLHDLLKMTAEITGASIPHLTLPGGLVRPLAGLLRLTGNLLPIDTDELDMAGYYFYYDTSKARRELNLPEPIPARQAISAAYQWFRAQSTNN